MSIPFSGFNGSIWSVALASLDYLTSVLKDATNFANLEPVIIATLQTMLNGVDTINLFSYYNSWQIEQRNFQEILSLPLSYTTNSQIVSQNRFNTYSNALSALAFSFILPDITQVVTNLKSGVPAIKDPDLLNFCRNFGTSPTQNGEIAPVGLTPDNFHGNAQAIADAFDELATIIAQSQGVFLTQAYDAAVRQKNLTQIQANVIAQFTWPEAINSTKSPIANVEIGIGASEDISYIWNQLVVLPTLLKGAELLGNAPYLVRTQQASVQKFVMLTMAQNLAVLLLSIQQPLTQNIRLATIGNGQSLMDIAAQKLQNFEAWTQIAAANKLQPPWIVQASNDPSVAHWGQQLVLPGSEPAPNGTPPSYLNNFLGVDVYLGPLGKDMIAWTGDFQTISGYGNLQISLARRLLTAIGSLIYHSNYGSEIPLLIGTIASQNEAGYLTALAQSAILSDPRVDRILNGHTEVLNNFAFAFTGEVIPQGMTSQTVQINEVLS